MKVLSSLFSHLFCIFFLCFSWAFMDYWNGNMTGEDVIASTWMNRASVALVVYCLFICIMNIGMHYKGIHLVCLLWVIIMPIIMWVTKSSIFAYSFTILWPLLFEMGYMFCYECEERNDVFRKLMMVIALYGLFLFLRSRFDITQQSNTIYFVLLTLPWLLFERENRTRLIYLIIISLLALISLKRSAILSMAVIWLFYVLEMVRKPERKMGVVFFLIVFYIGASWVFESINENIGGVLEERVNREETDQGRNRLAIWGVTSDMIVSSPMPEIITGHGHYAVRKDSPLEISAHNDLLEVIYDYGIVIFILYICLWVHVIRRSYYLYKVRSSLFLPYASALSIFVVMSMVSHLILYASYFMFLVLFWGMAECLIDNVEFEDKEECDVGEIELNEIDTSCSCT